MGENLSQLNDFPRIMFWSKGGKELGDTQGRLPSGGVSSSLAVAVLAARAPAGFPLGMLWTQTPCSRLLLHPFRFLQPPRPLPPPPRILSVRSGILL